MKNRKNGGKSILLSSKKKNSFYIIIALFLTYLLVISFTLKTKSSSSEESILLQNAINQNLISATFISNGNYSGKSILCKLKNLKSKTYKIVIPAGTYFMAPSTDEQDLIIPQEEFFVLKANESKNIVLNGYCCNLSNHAPKEDGKFTLIPSKAPKEMPKLLAFLKGKKYENHTLQDAIWAVTNKSSVTNVYGTDAKAVEALRKELFALTGQKEDWYQSPQQTTVNEDRSINRETASISGDLEYEAKKGSKVHTEVFSPEGIVKIKTDDKELTMSGTLSFHFKVEVQGWKKGKYQVKVIENSKVIKSYDFNV